MDNKIVWLVWLNNGMYYDDEEVWLIDVRDDSSEKANQIGFESLNKYWDDKKVPQDRRGDESYAYYGGNAHFWIQERMLNSVK